MKLIFESYNKQDIQNMFSDMYDEFMNYSDELGFCTFAIINPDIKWLRANATKKLGECRKIKSDVHDGRIMNVFDIALNPLLLEYEDGNDKFIKDIIAHEFCHTLPGCFNHGAEFHNKAKLINNLMGYHIDTKADMESSAYFMKVLNSQPAPYKVICDNCGAEQDFRKINSQLKNPYCYKCAKCGKPYLVTYKLDNRTGKYKELDDREFINHAREFYGTPPLQVSNL